jgi:hypothetical protein
MDKEEIYSHSTALSPKRQRTHTLTTLKNDNQHYSSINLQLRTQAMEEDDVDNVPILLALLLLNVVIKAGYMLVVYYKLPDRRWPTRAVKPHYHYGRIDRHNRVQRKTFTAAGVFRDISSSHFML